MHLGIPDKMMSHNVSLFQLEPYNDGRGSKWPSTKVCMNTGLMGRNVRSVLEKQIFTGFHEQKSGRIPLERVQYLCTFPFLWIFFTFMPPPLQDHSFISVSLVTRKSEYWLGRGIKVKIVRNYDMGFIS